MTCLKIQTLKKFLFPRKNWKSSGGDRLVQEFKSEEISKDSESGVDKTGFCTTCEIGQRS